MERRPNLYSDIMRRDASRLVCFIFCVASAACRPSAPALGSPAVVLVDGPPERLAEVFLASLSDTARARAMLRFDDTARTTWHYVPLLRPGVSRRLFGHSTHAAAEALMRTALGSDGIATAYAIMRHERLLGELESANGRPDALSRRDSSLYYWAVFGTPARGTPWGWRVEGHHLSINVTHAGTEGAAVAPVFMGVSPARVPSGPQAGLRLLAREEDEARGLWALLDPLQQRKARLRDSTFRDIVTQNVPRVAPFAPVGLSASEMSLSQRAQLRHLLEVYTRRLSPAFATKQLARIDGAGFGALHFGWAGSDKPGEAHYYRVHGPTVLVEYDNTQSQANHIHTVWRDLENDFGGDLLRAHYVRHSHAR